MKNCISVSLDKLFSLAFGVAVFCFFAFVYPFHLNYQEQYQMFLFSWDYFLNYFAKPGGISDYIGNFFTQFYFYSWVGAIIIAALLVVLQRIVWFISKKSGVKQVLFPLTVLPSLLYWGLLCDENYLLGGLIAMLLVSCFIALFVTIKQVTVRLGFALASIPVLFWIAGGAFVLLPLFFLFFELLRRTLKVSYLIVFIIVAGIWSYTVPTMCRWLFLQYPLRQVWIGTDYFRDPVNFPASVGLIAFLLLSVPFVLYYFSNLVKHNYSNILFVIQVVVLVSGGYFIIRHSVDLDKEEVMAYDFNCRMRKWNRIIAMAEKKTPTTPLSVACLNLALAKEDLLGERMFKYFQKGVGGLMPDFVRDCTIPMIAGEVYYHLGFINTAQRFAFEAMEALPDYQKSSRAIMRLAETNIINGNYAVAAKYLHLLQKTFYYREWATNALATIKDEKLVNLHPEWGWLRKCRTQKDFLFSEGEKEMMLGTLFEQNRSNRMAFEYLMACTLLTKDIKHFLQYFPLGESLRYRTIPKSYQEILYLAWVNTNKDSSRNIPYPISNSVKQRLNAFRRMPGQANSDSNKNIFSDTYWYYLYFVN
jgi:hypothetical protein